MRKRMNLEKLAFEKTCYNCGNKNCHIFYSAVKQDVAEHHETYEYNVFDCKNHDKWKELKVEEIRTDNTETLKNALERIKELEKQSKVKKQQLGKAKELLKQWLQANICDSVVLFSDTEQFLKETDK